MSELEYFKQHYYLRNTYCYNPNDNDKYKITKIKEIKEIKLRDKLILLKNNSNRIKNINNRLDTLKNRIKNDIAKGAYNKHYQVKSMWEYNELKTYLKTLDIKPKYQLWWCNSINGNYLKMNSLDKIISSYDDNIESDCDSMHFIDKKVPVIYAYFCNWFSYSP